MSDIPADHPLCRLFAGVTEQAFVSTLGVADPPLVDYVSGLLARFLHADTIYCVRDAAGRRVAELAALAVAADALPDGGRRRELHRHVGDYALFWSGLYPEAVNRRPARPGPDPTANFTALGKRSYGIASTFADDPFAAEAPVLFRLGEQFELCVEGLREVRREFAGLAGRPLPPGAGLIG